jgi:hypothetical protein
MLVAKENIDPKWLLMKKKLETKNSMMKNVVIKKLATENVAIESCGNQNLW